MSKLKGIVYSGFLLALLAAAPFASAQEQEGLVLDSRGQVVVSGIIEDVYFNTFTLEQDTNENNLPLTVTLENFDLSVINAMDNLISEGTPVTVYGYFTGGGRLAANRIVQIR